jgi:hypothetical protein
VQSNQFDAAALNILFGTLHNNSFSKTIIISDNPRGNGSDTFGCDTTIATAKGWTIW